MEPISASGFNPGDTVYSGVYSGVQSGTVCPEKGVHRTPALWHGYPVSLNKSVKNRVPPLVNIADHQRFWPSCDGRLLYNRTDHANSMTHPLSCFTPAFPVHNPLQPIQDYPFYSTAVTGRRLAGEENSGEKKAEIIPFENLDTSQEVYFPYYRYQGGALLSLPTLQYQVAPLTCQASSLPWSHALPKSHKLALAEEDWDRKKTYAEVIIEAIGYCGGRATLAQIFKYMSDVYPDEFQEQSKKKWQNIVRHTLSSSNAFIRKPFFGNRRNGVWLFDRSAWNTTAHRRGRISRICEKVATNMDRRSVEGSVDAATTSARQERHQPLLMDSGHGP